MNDRIRAPRHDDLVYDVGLHLGEDTEFYLKKGFRVVAFEADPELARLCRQKFGPAIAEGRLTILEGAIVDLPGAARGPVRFYRNENVSVWGTTREAWAERNARLGTRSHAVEVEPIDFGEALRKHGIPHFMKIDIEGSDLLCLQALKKFEEKPASLSVESDKTSFRKIRREIETLVELGYGAFQAIEQSVIPRTQTPPYPAREGRYAEHVFPEGASGLFGAELPGAWKSRAEILRQYRAIRLGYALLGDDGLLTPWRVRGSDRLRESLRRVLGRWTGNAVPGWYDTHARKA